MNGLLYTIYLLFFVSHIPITILVDSQAGEASCWLPLVPLLLSSLPPSPSRRWRTQVAGPRASLTRPNGCPPCSRMLQCCRPSGSRRRRAMLRPGTLRLTKTRWCALIQSLRRA